MKILVTGGAGFIGSNLTKYIERTRPEHEVVVLDTFTTGLRSNLDGVRGRVVEGSILDLELLDGLAKEVDAIVHLGAIPSVPRSIDFPRPSHEANATGTLNILEAARAHDVQHVSVASSSSVYGANPALPKSELEWTRPMSPYAVTKLATESYTVAYKFSYGMSTAAFRFFNVYGPYQRHDHAYAAVVPKFIAAAMQGRPLTIQGDGTQSRDFTYIDSVCQVLLESVERKVSPDSPVNLAFGTQFSLLDVIGMLEDVMGRSIELDFVAPRVGDVKASKAESTLFSSLYPDVTPVPLPEGIKRTYEWMRDNIDWSQANA
ncbi:NAD-dependent epimerase/dehydratase family protein [Micrococcales bacterium 31B]|nr:NAD-dependent epimerase/dehydratase family protein [Micrococcales bacterium 31B]